MMSTEGYHGEPVHTHGNSTSETSEGLQLEGGGTFCLEMGFKVPTAEAFLLTNTIVQNE